MKPEVIQRALEICAKSRINTKFSENDKVSNMSSQVESLDDVEQESDLGVLSNHFDMTFLQDLKNNLHLTTR